MVEGWPVPGQGGTLSCRSGSGLVHVRGLETTPSDPAGTGGAVTELESSNKDVLQHSSTGT